MEERFIDETEEILDNNAGNIPEELKKYLDADEETLSKIEEVLSDIDDKKTSLNNEKEETENEFERRLREFTENLEKEKADAFDILAQKEQDLDAEKARIEDIKLREQGNQVNYVDSLVSISNKFNSKISTIEEAIKACEDNDTLTKALNEEKEKLEDNLETEYKSRKEDLDKVLIDIGIKNEPEVPVEKEESKETKVEKEPMPDIDIDFDVPDYTESSLLDNQLNQDHILKPDYLSGMVDDNEVVEHEKREDVINEIYQSKDVMEGHVFPYLKSIME